MIHPRSSRGGRAAKRRLEVGADDEAGLTRARERLLGDHRRWLAQRGLAEDDRAARNLVDLKWGYLDGHLGRWRVSDLHEILLSLFPRKVILDAGDVPTSCPRSAGSSSSSTRRACSPVTATRCRGWSARLRASRTGSLRGCAIRPGSA
ncbi:MAG: hypothetical protein ACRD0K_12140 [Egibacteraceae bacterium]